MQKGFDTKKLWWMIPTIWLGIGVLAVIVDMIVVTAKTCMGIGFGVDTVLKILLGPISFFVWIIPHISFVC